MSELTVSSSALQTKAGVAGISPVVLTELLLRFSPDLVQFLLDLLLKKKAEAKTEGLLDGALSLIDWKNLLADLLVHNKDAIISKLTDVETAALDKIIAALQYV